MIETFVTLKDWMRAAQDRKLDIIPEDAEFLAVRYAFASGPEFKDEQLVGLFEFKSDGNRANYHGTGFICESAQECEEHCRQMDGLNLTPILDDIIKSFTAPDDPSS